MKFSVVIPTYNRANFIEKTINSILQQSYQNFEVLVIDDGSTDNTQEIVEKINDKRLFYFKKENAERGAARNYGAKKASGDFINFFDSDDLAYENHLQTALETIETHTETSVFHLGFDIKTPDGKQGRKPSKIENINYQLINGNLLSCNGVFIKKEIALKNPFSEIRKLSASEDYLLWLQLASQYTITNNNKVTSTIIDHDERSVLSINKEALISRKELMLEMALSDSRVNKFYAKRIKSLTVNTYSYVALHLIMGQEKREGLRFLLKTLKTDITFIGTKRFLAIIKQILIA